MPCFDFFAFWYSIVIYCLNILAAIFYKHLRSVYFENSEGYWLKREYEDGREVYFEDSDGNIKDKREPEDMTMAEIIKKLAHHFNLSIDQLCSKLVAERIIKDYGRSQTTFKAVQMVKEELAQYGRNKQEKK